MIIDALHLKWVKHRLLVRRKKASKHDETMEQYHAHYWNDNKAFSFLFCQPRY